jgi:type II secretion system protein G
MRPFPRQAQAGFTLLELMVVLVIIGILMALVAPTIMGRPNEARVTAARADLQAIASALDLYKLDNFDYPTTAQGLAALATKPADPPAPPHWKEGGYLRRLPVDPWGNPYQYLCPGAHGAYDLYSLGAGGVPGQPDPQKMIGEWQP